MVDSINNGAGPVSSLLRAQQTGTINLNANTPQKPIIDQLANGARPTTVQPAEKSAGSSKGDKLPRGSLVDILV